MTTEEFAQRIGNAGPPAEADQVVEGLLRLARPCRP